MGADISKKDTPLYWGLDRYLYIFQWGLILLSSNGFLVNDFWISRIDILEKMEIYELDVTFSIDKSDDVIKWIIKLIDKTHFLTIGLKKPV